MSEKPKTSSRLLINEEPLQVLPSLAINIGLNNAIVLQQVHFWLKTNQMKKNMDNYREGRWWSWNSYEEWQATNFPWWSVATVRRAFNDLERRGLLISRQFRASTLHQEKWYTIDYDALEKVFTGQDQAQGDGGQEDGQDGQEAQDGAQDGQDQAQDGAESGEGSPESGEQMDMLNLSRSADEPLQTDEQIHLLNLSKSTDSNCTDAPTQDAHMFYITENLSENPSEILSPPSGGAPAGGDDGGFHPIESPQEPAERPSPQARREGALRALGGWEAKRRGMGGDSSRFPEDVRPYLDAFVSCWPVNIPAPKGGKGGGNFGLWILGLRELAEACGEFGPTLIKEYFERWDAERKNSPYGAPPFTVGHPRALVKVVSALAGEKRLNAGARGVGTNGSLTSDGGWVIRGLPHNEEENRFALETAAEWEAWAGQDFDGFIQAVFPVYFEDRDFWNYQRTWWKDKALLKRAGEALQPLKAERMKAEYRTNQGL